MLTVGLTGGIACGKSVVLQQLHKLGAATLDADQIVHSISTRLGSLIMYSVNNYGIGSSVKDFIITNSPTYFSTNTGSFRPMITTIEWVTDVEISGYSVLFENIHIVLPILVIFVAIYGFNYLHYKVNENIYINKKIYIFFIITLLSLFLALSVGNLWLNPIVMFMAGALYLPFIHLKHIK